MRQTIRMDVARWCRTTRLGLDVTQQQLADAAGVSRAYIAAIEGGRANPSIALVERIGEALGLEFGLTAKPPSIIGERQPRDVVHARCSWYVQRRLSGLGLHVAREVEILDRRTHGWIDLLAFDPTTGTLLIIEIKTSLDDIGRLERQLGWYERLASSTDEVDRWRPVQTRTWLLLLASRDVDAAISAHRSLLAAVFPCRASEMLTRSSGAIGKEQGRGLALIDPRSRRRDWLIPCRTGGAHCCRIRIGPARSDSSPGHAGRRRCGAAWRPVVGFCPSTSSGWVCISAMSLRSGALRLRSAAGRALGPAYSFAPCALSVTSSTLGGAAPRDHADAAARLGIAPRLLR